MGGLLILLSMVLATLLWADLSNLYVWVVLLVTLSFGLLGFADDYLKVSKRSSAGVGGGFKLAFQFMVAGAASYVLMQLQAPPLNGAVTIPFFKDVLLQLGWMFIAFAAIVVVGASNAVNLTDGLDGLAIVPVMIAASTFLLISYLVGNVGVRGLSADPLTCRAPESLRYCWARWSARGSDSSGTTRRQRWSSWATPARCLSAACSVRLRSR